MSQSLWNISYRVWPMSLITRWMATAQIQYQMCLIDYSIKCILLGNIQRMPTSMQERSSDSFMYHSPINPQIHVQYQEDKFTSFPHSSLVECCIFVCLVLFYLYTLKLTLFWTSFTCAWDYVEGRKQILISFFLNPVRGDPFHSWA